MTVFIKCKLSLFKMRRQQSFCSEFPIIHHIMYCGQSGGSCSNYRREIMTRLNSYAGESAGRDVQDRFGPGEIHIDLIEMKSKSIT